MFTPRLGLPPASQKNRHNRALSFKRSSLLLGWTRFIALGQGAVTVPFLEKLYIWGKRITRYPTKTMRFWVNLQAAQVVTKKPANLRMGKGKGGRAGVVASVSPGSTLLAVSFLRRGLVAKICRQISVRTSFKVGASRPLNPFAYRGLVTAKTQRRYTAYRMYDLRYFFRKANLSHMYAFTLFLFKWSRKVPRLKRIAGFNYFAVPEEFDLYRALGLFSALSTTKVSWAWAFRGARYGPLPANLLKKARGDLTHWARQLAPDRSWSWVNPRNLLGFTDAFLLAARSLFLTQPPHQALAANRALVFFLETHFILVTWIRLFVVRGWTRSLSPHPSRRDGGFRLLCNAFLFKPL